MAHREHDEHSTPEMPQGWRSSRRGSRSRKQARRARRVHEARETVTGLFAGVRRWVGGGLYPVLMALGALGLILLLLWGAASAINGIARWNARRLAAALQSPEGQAEAARDNLLVIGVTEGRATGFLALRLVGEQQQVFGIAIPDGAFLEVPGQGFERMGDSFLTGAETSLAAVTNFFTVPFTEYIVVDTEVYQQALTGQSVSGLLGDVHETSLDEGEFSRWNEVFQQVPSEDIALVPMPVKPINVGSQTYFEPQRDEIADLISSWWGVTIESEDVAVRVIVYNGSGEPGIAGTAAQQLIRGGFRVVDTKNADRFDYDTTQIIVQRGDAQRGEPVREVLGVGEVVVRPANQEVADIIVIIGSDFQPTARDTAQ